MLTNSKVTIYDVPSQQDSFGVIVVLYCAVMCVLQAHGAADPLYKLKLSLISCKQGQEVTVLYQNSLTLTVPVTTIDAL